MASIVVFTAPGGKPVLMAALEWRLLPAESKAAKLDSHVREAASEFLGTKHAARAAATKQEEVTGKGGKTSLVTRTKVGFVVPTEGTSQPRGAHSLAAAFANWTADHEKSVLCVRIADEVFAVVVVIDGLPMLDTVAKDSASAFELVKSYLGDDTSVFSDDLVTFPGALDHDDLLEKIARSADKRSAIKAIPVDVVKMAVLVLIAASALAGVQYWLHLKKEKERLEALERQREADPIPKYLNALAAARQEVGIHRDSIKAGVDYAMRVPLTPPGWNATRIGCTARIGCEVVYARTTGTFEGLMKAVPFLKLTPADVINLNEARMTWDQKLENAKLDPSTQLPPMTAFVQGPEASKLQDWLVAGLSIQLTPQQLWPQAEGVPATFKHPEALATGKFDIDSISLPQLVEAVVTAPTNVNWTAWSIEVGDVKQEPLSRAKGRLSGNYYVINN